MVEAEEQRLREQAIGWVRVHGVDIGFKALMSLVAAHKETMTVQALEPKNTDFEKGQVKGLEWIEELITNLSADDTEETSAEETK